MHLSERARMCGASMKNIENQAKTFDEYHRAIGLLLESCKKHAVVMPKGLLAASLQRLAFRLGSNNPRIRKEGSFWTAEAWSHKVYAKSPIDAYWLVQSYKGNQRNKMNSLGAI